MKKITPFVWAFVCSSLPVLAENAFIHLEYQNMDFAGSKQKKQGQSYVVHTGYKYETGLYEAAWSKTKTETFQPPLPNDLKVDKYYLKYTYAMDKEQSLSLNYAAISDNLAKETDGGHIYGLSYRYKNMKFSQYLSDYKNFNVYQTELGYLFKSMFKQWKVAARLNATYIYLQDRKSNDFSAQAKEDYFTPSLMIHAVYDKWHVGAGAYMGKRIFAVMHDGFGVQHHAMEFDRTFMVAAGRHFGAYDITLKYLYMRANEVPLYNPNVKIDSVIFSVGYRF